MELKCLEVQASKLLLVLWALVLELGLRFVLVQESVKLLALVKLVMGFVTEQALALVRALGLSWVMK